MWPVAPRSIYHMTCARNGLYNLGHLQHAIEYQTLVYKQFYPKCPISESGLIIFTEKDTLLHSGSYTQ